MAAVKPMAIRRIVLAANGPVKSPKTWSNVPTCLYNALVEHQIQVVAVNLAPSRFLKALYLLWTLPRRLSHPGSTYDYFRSALHRIHVRLRLGLVALILPTTVPFFVLSFSFPVKTNRRRVCLISDWTYEHYITSHLGRQPDALEIKAIDAERRALQQADLSVSIFPAVAARLARSIPAANVHYLGHGVNRLTTESASNPQRQACRRILFVGGQRYATALKHLLDAFHVLATESPLSLALDVIGFDQATLAKMGAGRGVNGYGYLNKSNPDHARMYAHVFSQATVFVNVSPAWFGYSSMLEALSCGIPAIVSPNDELKLMFGEAPSFIESLAYEPTSQGVLCLAKAIANLVKHPDYVLISQTAVNAVASITWGNFVNRLLEVVDDLPDNP